MGFFKFKNKLVILGLVFMIILTINIIQCSNSRNRLLQVTIQFDPLCLQFNKQTGFCEACSCRSVFDKDKVCQKISDLCATWNINTGLCTSCYSGYQLINGTCQLIPYPFDPSNYVQIAIENPNCLTQSKNGVCLSCRPYYIFNCGDCQITGQNPNCTKYNVEDICIECEQGFKLDNNNICQEESIFQNETKPDTGSKGKSPYPHCLENNLYECTKCQEGYLQEYWSRQCEKTTTQCAQGCALCSKNECFACSQGYSAQGWPICQSCSYMYAKNSQGICKPIQRDCSKFQHCTYCLADQCLSCESKYQLSADYKSCVLIE